MSFYTALTGLDASTAQLSVTSNNIANAGTKGFKRSRANFGDIFATSPLQKASSVIGQGTSLKGVSQEFSQGNITVSSNALDLAISGDGFYPLQSSDGLQNIYTRNGQFSMNDQNNVVNTAGQTLLAASVDSAGKADLSKLAKLTIPKQTTGEAKQTSLIQLGLNLPADAQVITSKFNRNDPTSFNKSTSLTVYDKAGNDYLATVYYAKTQNASQADPNNRWQTYVFIGDTQVNPSLLQATNSGGESLYVNQYGVLKPYSEVKDQLVNAKTAMFSLNQLTDTRTSVPATITGKAVTASPDSVVPPTAFDLSADHGINFSTLSESQKLSLKTLFQVSIDGAKTPVTMDLSSLADQDQLYNGDAIAKLMTNALNKAYGDDKYWDMSASPKFVMNLTPTSNGAATTSLNIDLSATQEKQLLSFATPAGGAAQSGSVTVDGVVVSISQHDSAKQIAAAVAAAITSNTPPKSYSATDNGDGTVTLVYPAPTNPDLSQFTASNLPPITTSAATGVTTDASILAYPIAQNQIQKLVFQTPLKDGQITIAGVSVGVTAGEPAASIAADVASALQSDSTFTAVPGRLVTDNGDGTLTITYAAADGNQSLTLIQDPAGTGAGVDSFITQDSYSQLNKLTTQNLVNLIQSQINNEIRTSGAPNLNVTVSYDPVTQGFKFIEANGAAVTVGGGTSEVGALNTVLGLPAMPVATATDGSGSYLATNETSPNGGLIRNVSDERYGLQVVYDSVKQQFSIASGTTGDTSSIKITGVSSFARSALGITNAEVGTSATALRGVVSKPATMMGSSIAVNVNNNFPVGDNNNTFVVSVDDVKGTVTLPVNANYTLDGFMKELQDRINRLANSSGETVSGVTVSYDRANNAFRFTTGTANSNSFIAVSGSGTWGLAAGQSGRGQTSNWVKPTQYLDYSTGVGVPQYIDKFGAQTSSADAFTGLPAWSPVYLDKGQLTFDTAGKLVSPLQGAQLDTIYLPSGKGALRINIDYSKSTQTSQPFAVLSQSQDGAPEGDLIGVNIGDDGLVKASFSNGSQQSLGKIVLVNFSNPGGLRQIGDSSYYASDASGTAKFGEAGAAGYGTVRAGALENANVDLTQELVDLITEQRNFQANAKAIQTSSDLTQAIIQIRN